MIKKLNKRNKQTVDEKNEEIKAIKLCKFDK